MLKFQSLFIALSLLAISACSNKPNNIIFLIGDGMGPPYTAAYRYYQDDPNTLAVESTIFDELLVGMSSTYPEDKTIVTDSAASATALSSGEKTYNGAVGVDNDQTPLLTLMERAKQRDMNTALVVTSQINHATPASFAAHNESRDNYDAIADAYFDHRIEGRFIADLMLGGGTKYFVREDRNLVEEFEQAGYQTISNLGELELLQQLPALGLFAPKGLASAIDDEASLRLSKMTEQALKLLNSGGKRFFMLVEGSQIDWCGHANDIACAMAEMRDFAETLKVVKSYIDQHPDTLMIATADHSTGGLSLGRGGRYQWDTSVIKKVKGSASHIASEIFNSQDLALAWHDWVDFELSAEELERLQGAQLAGQRDLAKVIAQIVAERSFTGWTTGGHNAIDVPVFAYGKGAEMFRGHMDNTDIADKLFGFMSDE